MWDLMVVIRICVKSDLPRLARSSVVDTLPLMEIGNGLVHRCPSPVGGKRPPSYQTENSAEPHSLRALRLLV